jgi:hypothetical protein
VPTIASGLLLEEHDAGLTSERYNAILRIHLFEVRVSVRLLVPKNLGDLLGCRFPDNLNELRQPGYILTAIMTGEGVARCALPIFDFIVPRRMSDLTNKVGNLILPPSRPRQ